MQKGNCEFHALPHLSPKRVSWVIIIGFSSSLDEGKKHSGRFFPAFCNCSKNRMFLEAFMSLSIQHNLHSLSLQRITLLIIDFFALVYVPSFFLYTLEDLKWDDLSPSK